MYKDREKQKQTQKERIRRYRAKHNVTPSADVTPECNALPVTPSLPAKFGQQDCQCMHCQQNLRSEHKLIINHGEYKTAAQLMPNEVNRQSLPGDVDYKGECFFIPGAPLSHALNEL